MKDANQLYLDSVKNMYESLHDFSITNNVLYYKKDNVVYQLPLIVNLSAFNPALYSLSPEEIINVLYVYQLLYKSVLSDQEKELMVKYTNKYFEYNNNPELSPSNVFGLSIPVYTSYDDAFANSPGAMIIRAELTSKNEALEKYQNSVEGRQKQMVRTLKKDDLPNTEAYLEYEEFANKLNRIQNAGFTTIFIIIGTVVATAISLLFLS